MSATTTKTTKTAPPTAGELLRDWRRRRRLSQLDVSLDAAVSARHLSFVETGRSKPSRELLLHLAEYLDIPLRDRNALLLAGGYAPHFTETPLEDEAMTPARAALDKILAGHAPFPACVVDRKWDLVSANAPLLALLTDGVAPELLEAPANTIRVSLHPDGLAPRIVNFAEWSEHLLMRLQRQALLSQDPEISALHDELSALPNVRQAHTAAVDAADMLYVPLRLRTTAGVELSFFSTIATFGTALDITLSELAIESFFPADPQTAEILRESATNAAGDH